MHLPPIHSGKFVIINDFYLFQTQTLTQCRPKNKLVSVPQKNIPYPTSHIQRHRLGEHRINPVEQVQVGSETGPFEVPVQFRQVAVEHLVVRVVVGVHLRLVESERGQVQGLVQQVRETNEGVARFHVEDQDGRYVGHALYVTDVWSKNM